MRILLFDIDGTLLLTNGGGKTALQIALADEFGLGAACTNVLFSGRTDRSLLTELLERNGLPADEDHVQRLRRRYAAALPGVLAEQGGNLLPGVAQLLPRLATVPRVRSYVMTGNLPETATHKLEYFNLLKSVHGIFGGDLDHHRDDLARRSAKILCQRYQLESLSGAVVIGDTPADIRCGHAVGAQVFAVCTGRYQREELEAENPLRIEEDLSDVERVFEFLSS